MSDALNTSRLLQTRPISDHLDNMIAEAIKDGTLPDLIVEAMKGGSYVHQVIERISDELNRLHAVEQEKHSGAATEGGNRQTERGEPYEIDWPGYNGMAMGCGLEDRGITDRYEAMYYGWACAIEAVAERLPEAIYTHPQIPEGWKLVPIEPTQRMRKAGTAARTEFRGMHGMRAEAIYKAMLDAAPKHKPLTNEGEA